MKGITTNIITFSEEKSYLINFFNSILQQKSKMDKLIIKEFYSYLKVLLSKAPKGFFENTNSLKFNQIVLDIPNWNDLNLNYNFYLTIESQNNIKKWIYDKFWLCFNSNINAYKNAKIDLTKAYYLFMEEFNIPEEKLDMLKKHYTRYKNELITEKTKKITSQFKGILSLRSAKLI